MKQIKIFLFFLLCSPTAFSTVSNKQLPESLPTNKQERTFMGDFQHYTYKNVYSIIIEDSKGKKLGQVTVTANIERKETYPIINDRPPEPGPAGRVIVDEFVGYTVYGTKWGSALQPNEKPPGKIDQIVSDLKANQGIKNGETLIKFKAKGFEEAFTQNMKVQYNYKATFQKVSL